MRKMFALRVLGLCVMVLLAPMVFAEDITLSSENVPYLYESRAKIPAPDYKLAEMISVEYRGAQDEFTKRDLFKKIKPVLDERLAQGRATTEIVIHVNTTIGEYDFEKQAFPTGFNESTYLPFDNNYAAVFANVQEVAFLAMPEDKARNFSGVLRQGRKGELAIKATVVGVEEKKLDAWRSKVLKLHVKEFKLLHESGKEFGSKSL